MGGFFIAYDLTSQLTDATSESIALSSGKPRTTCVNGE